MPDPSAPMTDFFACHADASSPTLAWAIIAICAGFIAYTTKRLFSFQLSPTFRIAPRDKMDLAEKSTPQIYDDLIPNLPYLMQCLHLSELMIAELTSAIQSYEKKALAIITGAAALIGFIATKDWCGNPINWIGFASMGFCILSAGWAVFILAQSHTGYGGASPRYTVDYYKNKLLVLEEECLDTQDIDEKYIEQCYLCLMMLKHYSEVVYVSQETARTKANRFTYAAWFMFSGLISTIGWLLIKALPIAL